MDILPQLQHIHPIMAKLPSLSLDFSELLLGIGVQCVQDFVTWAARGEKIVNMNGQGAYATTTLSLAA